MPGIAIYGGTESGRAKLTVQSANPELTLPASKSALEDAGVSATVTVKSTHAVVDVASEQLESARAALLAARPGLRVMSAGESVEIYKEVGLPEDVIARFDIAGMAGTHGIGHTRMATESAVTTHGAHPFSTGTDQCLVHNGSLSNHNNLRRELIRDGHDLRDRERHRGRGRLSHRKMAHAARISARR